jgi:asparagine synthase (glutamine-hydrolysing)
MGSLGLPLTCESIVAKNCDGRLKKQNQIAALPPPIPNWFYMRTLFGVKNAFGIFAGISHSQSGILDGKPFFAPAIILESNLFITPKSEVFFFSATPWIAFARTPRYPITWTTPRLAIFSSLDLIVTWVPQLFAISEGCGRRTANEYVEHFQNLIQSAVADRLRVDRAGILLSGGLDSGAIAATARELSGSPLGARDLRAYTVINKLLISDRDGAYAQKVADYLHIRIQFLEMSRLQPFERWNDSQPISPAPVGDPLFAGLSDELKMIAADCRVVLCGEGADNLMYFEMLPFAKQLLRKRDLSGLVREVSGYLRVRSSIWPGIRRRIKGIFEKDSNRSLFPSWLDAEFSSRLNLNERWKEWSDLPASRPHPILPKAHASLQIPQWTNTFEQESPGASRYPVEVRYPFLDLRIVNFLLALPPFPFFFEKKLLRDTMTGRLPEDVRLRPKTPLSGDPLSQSLQKNVTTTARWNQVHWNMDIGRYVNRAALLPLLDSSDPEQISVNVRPFCLNFWLRSARPVLYNLRAEVRNA